MFGAGNANFTRRRIKKSRKQGKRVWNKNFLLILKYAGIGLTTVILMLVVYFREETGEWFKASVLEAPQAFNGTVPPVSQVPDWTHFTGDIRTKLFSDFKPSELVDLPNYDLTKMTFPNESLVWGNTAHDIIRNTKITYPVVYMGNYELDHTENAGSHLAVDIKMPVGTPVHAIANGKVVKVSMQSDGFGHHVVIKHTNVPDPDTGSMTTLYSCYNHMSDIDLSEGQNVLKGEIIGKSGNTGTSTTPHLHFQDRQGFRPMAFILAFFMERIAAAGLSFFEAVNAGLGKSNATQNTINPMKYVYQYLGSYSLAADRPGGIDNSSADSDNSSDTQDQEDTASTENTQVNGGNPPVEVVADPHESGPQIDPSLFTFDLIGEKVSLINNGVTITAVDNNNQLSKLGDSDQIRVELSGVGSLNKKVFTKSDFNNKAIKIVVNSPVAGIANIMIGKSSHQINFIEQAASVASLRIDTDGYFQKSILETVKIVAIDESGNPTPTVNFSGTISITAKEGQAIIIPDRLAVNDFQNGEATVRVKVDNENRVVLRAQNGALVGESAPISMEEKTLFSDVTRGNNHYDAIKYLYDNGIINGYSDGTFKPNETVNRVEALKMLMLAFNVGTGPAQQLAFSDTDNSAWYATTLGTAVTKGIVAGYTDGTFKPSQTVNKAEYLKMMFKTNDIEITDSVTANPYADVPKDTWYAPYAYLTNRKNLLDVTNNLLDPANGMTRGDVAETIYRLKYVLDNNLVTYSK